MQTILVSSLAVFLLAAVILVVVAVRSPSLPRLALNFLLRKKRLTTLTVVGLIVSSTIITGCLAVGDSMRSSVIEEVFANLSEVDEVVYSNGLFNESVHDSVSASLADVTDGMAPLIVVKASSRNSGTWLVEPNVNVVGFDTDFLGLGELRLTSGDIVTSEPGDGTVLINENLANKLGLQSNQYITIDVRNPEFSIESIYSKLAGKITIDLTVTAIVKDFGLGRFNLESSGGAPNNIFIGLDYLQFVLGANSKINTIVVSNEGDTRQGVERTAEVMGRLRSAVDDAIGYEDTKFDVRPFNYIRIDNWNVFFDGKYLDMANAMVGSVAGVEAISPLTTYFVNNISAHGRHIPYSVVTGLDPQVDYEFGAFVDNLTSLPIVGNIQDDEIIITDYTEGKLGARVGDTVSLNFTVYDSMYSPVYITANFTVKYVIKVEGKAYDPDIMPPIPGIRGTSSCGEWDPPWVTIDKQKELTNDDLFYWQNFGGTPKAYITLDKAQALWSNDLGNLTTIKVKVANSQQSAPVVGAFLNSTFVAGDAGLTISPAKQSGIESAEGTQLLTETFLAFGFIVIISGIILEGTMVASMMEGRRKEIATLKTLGMKRKKITEVFAIEGFLLSMIASVIGLIAGLLLGLMCIWLTNNFWSNMVEGRTVSLMFTLETVVIGFVAGLMISFVAFVLFAYRASGSIIAGALKGDETAPATRGRPRAAWFLFALGVVVTSTSFILPFLQLVDGAVILAMWLLGPTLMMVSSAVLILRYGGKGHYLSIISLAGIIWTLFWAGIVGSLTSMDPFIPFFVVGFLLVVFFVMGIAGGLRPLAKSLSRLVGGSGGGHTTLRMALLSPSRRVRKSALSLFLIAIVVFTFLGLSVNIQGQQQNLSSIMEHQGAGYDVLAQSSISLRFDLGNETDRIKNNITEFPENVTTVQFLTVGQIGGSCSNLKRNLPPRLIAVQESFVNESTLRFQAPSTDSEPNWMGLQDIRSDGAIPAVGDYNTVVWILGKNVGDYVSIEDESGSERNLVITGIFENSIFPGSLFISEGNLNELYPTSAEYRLFLFKSDNSTGLVSYLESSFQAYGMDATLVSDLVRDNLSVEWSYIGLFQALLLLGLFVGILGIATSSSKAVEERKPEIGAIRALGFTRPMVWGFMVIENLYLASLGSAVGILSGLLIAFAFFGRGTLLSFSAAVPWLAAILVFMAIGVAAFIAALVPAQRAALIHPVEALRRDQ